MSETNRDVDPRIAENRERIRRARREGIVPLLKTFVSLSGPGWLQSAITLGGGSLANALYLGVLGGFAFMWLQPLAMMLGVVMLSAIGYVTLSTGESPFRAINRHINPVLGWGWILATLMANCVWSLPQFNLATAAIRQNLAPGLLGEGAMPAGPAQLIIGVAIAGICVLFVFSYDSGRRGVKVFDVALKAIVGLIVLSFFGVVVKMTLSGKSVLDWHRVWAGLVPNLSLLSRPAPTFDPYLQAVPEAFRGFWENLIVSQQRDVMIGAAATAVGINMTFLLPYSMLKRGWDSEFRGLAIFDLSTGLFIPFILVTGCVVIVSAGQFHTRPAPGLLGEKDADGHVVVADKGLMGQYHALLKKRLAREIPPETLQAMSPDELQARAQALPLSERRLAAMLVKRDANQLAQSLAPLTGKTFANLVFGFGVLGMAVSSIIILMLINGFVLCEMLNRPLHGTTYRLGALMPLVGMLGPFVWGASKARFWLAVPTSVFGMVLLPIAYITFFLMMNSRSLLGDARPRGAKRLAWNLLMGLAVLLAGLGSLWSIWSKLHTLGLWIVGLYLVLVCLAQVFYKKGKNSPIS